MLTLETILDRNNLNRAYKAVVANKGSAGVDGMEVGDLLGHLKTHGAALVQSITEGQYRPSPVRRVLIPKENGQTRPLGIPTVVDRRCNKPWHKCSLRNTKAYSAMGVMVSAQVGAAPRPWIKHSGMPMKDTNGS